MKIKILLLVLTGGFLALAAWFVTGPSPAHADKFPAKYRETVSKGLEYLAKNQHWDGHWEVRGQHSSGGG